MESNNIDRKKPIITIIFAISLILGGFILSIILAIKFVGEDGYIREDAPGEWLFITLIPIILGMIILFIPMLKMKKEAESYQKVGNASEISSEQSNRGHERDLKTLDRVQLFLIILTVILFAIPILLFLLGIISWKEFIDSLF